MPRSHSLLFDVTLSTTPQESKQSPSFDSPFLSSSQLHVQQRRNECPEVDMEKKGRKVWGQISRVEEFRDKYGQVVLDGKEAAQCYLFTTKPRPYTFAFEAFATVEKASIMREELVFHPMFERIIERYTGSRAKPNHTLLETRSTDFCYRLTILVEAVPQCPRNRKLRLVREYAVLYHIWEQHRLELFADTCQPDILVGIPMPFEFVNVVGYPEYDFKSDKHAVWHQSLSGKEVPLSQILMPGSNMGVQSTLSYMSVEKLGPTLQYLVELMRFQRSPLSISTALKVFDQLLCRLMVLHKYGVILGTLDPRFINFGTREANKVLYISRFDTAVVMPTKDCVLSTYSERCASISVMKRREPHFVNDIESAFYVFLSLIFHSLPWDAAAAAERTKSRTDCSSEESTEESLSDMRADSHFDNATAQKKLLWSDHGHFQRLVQSRLHHEFTDPLYQGFTLDILTMLYSKTQEAVAQCSRISLSNYTAAIMKSTILHNMAYGALRKVIAAYFHFDGLSVISHDPVCEKKVEFLLSENPVDRRSLWDLSDWCWNDYFPAYGSGVGAKISSMHP